MRRLIAAADSQARERVLAEERVEILNDVAAVLDPDAIDGVPREGELQSLVHEALHAADVGADRAAQALLAATLRRLLHEGLGLDKLGQAFKAWQDREPDDALVGELRLVCIQRATVTRSATQTTRRADSTGTERSTASQRS